MVNEIDFKDPRYVMNCIVCLSKELAALKDEVASLRIAQQPHGAAIAEQICPQCGGEVLINKPSGNGFCIQCDYTITGKLPHAADVVGNKFLRRLK